jgi:two-component system chemotaxis response regulator CheY
VAKLKMLVVEDEFLSRQLLMSIVSEFGNADVAVDGQEAVDAVKLSYERGAPYDLVFLDIMLPAKNGQEVLKEIRAYESSRGIHASNCMKIVMTTAMSDAPNIMEAFRSQCDAYVTKPYNKKKIVEEFTKLGFSPGRD